MCWIVDKYWSVTDEDYFGSRSRWMLFCMFILFHFIYHWFPVGAGWEMSTLISLPTDFGASTKVKGACWSFSLQSDGLTLINLSPVVKCLVLQMLRNGSIINPSLVWISRKVALVYHMQQRINLLPIIFKYIFWMWTYPCKWIETKHKWQAFYACLLQVFWSF